MARRAETFTEYIHAHVEGTDPNRLFVDKLESRRIALACDLSVPGPLGEFEDPDDIPFKKMPNAFVLKPLGLDSKKGVQLLQREGRKYRELFTDEVVGKTDIRVRLREAIGDRTMPIIAEEFVPGPTKAKPIPFDYKVYTFDEQPAFVIQIDRNGKLPRLAFYDGQFVPLGVEAASSLWTHASPGAPLTPPNYHDLLEAASHISRYMDRPFVSVDLYTDGRKTYVGEITPSPGGPYFGVMFYLNQDFDRFLGDLWTRGVERRKWQRPEIATSPPAVNRSAIDAASVGWWDRPSGPPSTGP